MIHTIENDYLKVSVNDHGAELYSIFDKIHNREVIWQADPAYWKRHAPVLFPNVGRHFENHYRIGETEYPSKQHGFARDSEFTCVDMTTDSITHKLKSSDATKENYPYDFELKIKHVLEKNQVSVCWEVVNHSNKPMYFTIGGHPAFNVPAVGSADNKEDYLLTFDEQKSLTYLLLDPASGTALPDQTQTLELTDGTCKIDAHMFDHDALIFDNQIEKAGIAFPDGTPYLELTCHRFPNFGIWSVPGSSFVCLEPWMGRCDDCGFKGDLSEKANINVLNVDEIFNASYEIKIY
ncbi:aldose 1-epimerase family protein [Ruminococcus sp. AM29-26]|jgi:galactose mutarotase-like enzyme|nr:aldose 1-epimerase family protein [Ruminococcus sp. AM29-26]